MTGRKRKQLLFLTQRIPFPPNKGEKIPAYNFLRHLSKRYDVHLGAFMDDPADAPGIDALAKITASQCIVPLHPRLQWAGAGLGWLFGAPVSYAKFRSAQMTDYIARVVAEHAPKVIFAQSSNIGTYAIDWAANLSGQDAATLLHFVDVDSAKFDAYAHESSGFKRWIMAMEARRVRRQEARLADAADVVTLISDEEVELFRAIHPDASRLAVLRNGVDLAAFDPAKAGPSPFEPGYLDYVFTGAMDYAPNIEAVSWFARVVLPSLRMDAKNARFWIVGSNPVREVRALEKLEGVIVTGRVEAVQPYLRHATACLAPLQIARGVQNKVLEAMAMARPVIASMNALTGIGTAATAPVRIAESPYDWIRFCLWAARKPEEAEAVGQQARAFVAEQFSWQAQFKVLDQLIDSATTARGKTKIRPSASS